MLNALRFWPLLAYQAAAIATFAYLWSGASFNSWNWIFMIPIQLFFAEIWPIYWAVIHWFI